mgnify:CR=1 FL=1
MVRSTRNRSRDLSGGSAACVLAIAMGDTETLKEVE